MVKNIISGLICTLICYIAKQFYRAVKNANSDVERDKKHNSEIPSKKVMVKQFWIALLVMIASLLSAFFVPSESAKISLFIVFGISFLAIWGVFDELIIFYPDNNYRKDEPPKNTTGHTGEH